MRRMFLTAVTFIFVLAAVLPVAMAQSTERSIPITSTGFGAVLSPDGKTLVTFENTVLLGLDTVDPALLPMRVIDISTGEQLGELSGYTDYAADVAFTSDGSRMISLHANGDVIVWDVATLTATKTYQTLLMGSSQLFFAPDERTAYIVVAGQPQRIAAFDIETGAITQWYGKHFDSFFDYRENYTQFPGSSAIIISAAAVSPDGTMIATANGNDEIGLWSVADSSYTILKPEGEQGGSFAIRELVFTPDGNTLIYYSTMDKQLHVWDLAAKSETTFANMADVIALSPDGTKLAWGTWGEDGGSVSVASLDSLDAAEVIYEVPDGLRIAQRVSWLTFTPDSSQLVLGGFFASEPETNQIVVLDVP